MRLELQLGIFEIRLELATFGCYSPNQPTRITHILLSSLRVNVTNHMKKVLQQT